jgi:metal-responsive CopG/Arc/MetJ family transcriptional regulator
MKPSRVNLSLDNELWQEFKRLVPERQRSKTVADLLRAEIQRRRKEERRESLRQSFEEAAHDKERWQEAAEWEHLDVEAWPQ